MLFNLYGEGYFSPMATLCAIHLGPFIVDDHDHPRPSELYNVKVVYEGVCRLCPKTGE